MFGRSNATFDRLLEKATSQLLLEPDWTSIMAICDTIRQGDTNPKYAVAAIKKKFYHANPHVALYALQVMESCVKNCGALVHDEICTKQFMEELREIVKTSTDENIKNKVLELLQTWGMAFRSSTKYRIVTDTLNLMKAEGWKFPPVREAEAMYEADIAPEWAEGDVCHRCRVQFSTFTRQHHCRACGQVFCSKCSSKFCVLPKFGIEKEVRVCDSCFEKFGPKESDSADTGTLRPKKERADSESDLPAEYLASPLSKQPQVPEKPNGAGGKSEEELREEEELQLAIAISQSEAEEKEKLKKKATSDMLSNYTSNNNILSNTIVNGTNSNGVDNSGKGEPPSSEEPSSMNNELEKYLNRDYWESRERQDLIGAGQAKSNIMMANAGVVANPQRAQEVVQGTLPEADKAVEDELNEFTETLKTQLEIFVNRMKSNSSRGRPIANDTSVQTLFMNIMTMHGKLVRYIQDQEDSRVKYEGLQDKLTQIKDARAALDALREEEIERKRREQEELERQRQIQLAAKLEVMRKKKAEYLEYQRQLALQRMAEQEREVASKAASYMQQPGMYMGPPGNMPPNMYMPQQYPGMMASGPGSMPGQPPMFPVQGYPMPQQQGDLQQQQQQAGPVMGQLPSHPPPGQMGHPTQAPTSQMGQPAPPSTQMSQPIQSSTQMGGPPSSQMGPPPPSTQGGIPGGDQNSSFNMSGMAGALPQQYMMSPPQQQPQQIYAGMPQQQQQHMIPPQHQDPQPEAPSASLISFD